VVSEALGGTTAYRDTGRITAQGEPLWDRCWFDFIGGIELDYAQRLIESESIEVTAAFRSFQQRDWTPTSLDGRSALLLTSGDNPDRQAYLVRLEPGVLAIQCSRGVPLDEAMRAEQARSFEEIARAFLASEEAMTQARVPREPPPIQDPPRIPATLEECFTLLDETVSAEDIAHLRSIPEGDMIQYHFSVGMSLRNGWGLWAGSPLAQWFNERGVQHPDNMSGIILTSYWRHLHGEPIRLEEQIALYKAE
jgi:hypothetical protein